MLELSKLRAATIPWINPASFQDSRGLAQTGLLLASIFRFARTAVQVSGVLRRGHGT